MNELDWLLAAESRRDGGKAHRPGSIRGPLSKTDIRQNALFKKRIVRVLPSEEPTYGPSKAIVAEHQQPMAEDGVSGLNVHASSVLSKIIGKQPTSENIRQWLAEHRDWDGIIMGAPDNVPGAGRTACNEILGFFETHGYAKSELSGLSPPAIICLGRLIGEHPSGSGVRKWIDAHKSDWKDALYGFRYLHKKTLSEISAFLIAHGCERDAPRKDAQPVLSPAALQLLAMMSGSPSPTEEDLWRLAGNGALKTLGEVMAFLKRISAESAAASGPKPPSEQD